jgi:hypothetical protein
MTPSAEVEVVPAIAVDALAEVEPCVVPAFDAGVLVAVAVGVPLLVGLGRAMALAAFAPALAVVAGVCATLPVAAGLAASGVHASGEATSVANAKLAYLVRIIGHILRGHMESLTEGMHKPVRFEREAARLNG